MESEAFYWIGDILVISGMLVITIAVIGLFRMPDIYLRLHAASKAVFVGIIPVLIISLLFNRVSMSGRMILIFIFLALTTPVSAHTISRAAFFAGEELSTSQEDR